jgi:hypothetical protein
LHLTTLKEGLVVGARSMPGNSYDGHTLDEALEQTEILFEVKPEQALEGACLLRNYSAEPMQLFMPRRQVAEIR